MGLGWGAGGTGGTGDTGDTGVQGVRSTAFCLLGLGWRPRIGNRLGSKRTGLVVEQGGNPEW